MKQGHYRTSVLSVVPLLLGLLLAGGCATAPSGTDGTDAAYRRAVEDAAFPHESDIATNLVAIRPDNPALVWNADKSRLLVATWKSRQAYEQFLKPNDTTSTDPDYAVWVTTVPQVRKLCAGLVSTHPGIGGEAVNLRLKQYLGLDPHWPYDLFVELWVDPSDLFRPCVDPQTDDGSCNLHFGDGTPTVKNIANYPAFYRNLYYKSFRASAGVPWTGLGYTYDWGNPASEVGASEFILAPGSHYAIRDAVPTLEYCRAPDTKAQSKR